MWTLVTMCSMKLSFIPLGLNCGYFPSWLCHFSCCRCCSSVFSPLQSRLRRQVSYWLMKRLAVSGDVTWCLNQLFTSVTRLHVFSRVWPRSKSLLLVTFRVCERLRSWSSMKLEKEKCVAPWVSSSHSITQVSGYNTFSFSLYTCLWD